MLADLNKEEEQTQVSSNWMWFGLTEKLMLSDATKRKAIQNLTFVECSELLMLWDRRDEEVNKERRKQQEIHNKNKLNNF